MVVTTDSTALIARFDMLFSRPMKDYVKENGGGEFIRQLVLEHILAKLNGTRGTLSDTEIEEIQNAYDSEMTRERGKVA